MIGADDIAETAYLITRDTLRVLARCLSPENAEDYCLKCGVPPFLPPSHLTDTFDQFEQHLQDPGVDTAEQLANATTALRAVIDVISTSSDLGEFAENAALKLVLPAVVVAARNETMWGLHIPHYLYLGGRFLAVLNTRLQEAYPKTLGQTLDELLRDSLAATRLNDPGGGSEIQPDVLIGLIGAAVAIVVFELSANVPDRKRDRTVPFFDYGFDHPAIAGLEEPLASAKHAFATLVALNDADLKQSDYGAFEPQAPPVQKRGLAISFVPVVRTPEHGGGLWFAMDGRYSRTSELSASAKLTIEIDAGGGVLLTFQQPLDEAATGTIGAALDFTWDDPSYASWSSQQIPEGVSVRARRLALHVEAGASASTGAASTFDLAGFARVEQAELVVGKLPLIGFLAPSGFRIAFDAGLVASLRRAEVRFEGGLATELVVPVNRTLGPATVNTVTLRAAAEREQGPTPSQAPGQPAADQSGFALRATGNISLRIFGLTVQIDGVGGLFTFGSPPQLDGSVGGVLDSGWQPVWPDGVGLSLVWKSLGVTGSGFLGYDDANNRLFGGLSLEKPGKFSLKGIALCEESPNGRHHWMVVASLEWPRSGGAITVDGIGALYGTNRHSVPQAFLDGLGSGVLDALVLPGDPVPRLPAYIAALNSLFPADPADDGEIVGVIFKIGALDEKVKIALGLIVDTGGSASALKLYVILTVVAAFPNPDTPLVRIEAAGVAVWDASRDEFDLRIVLRNSKLFGAELTGEASAFYGDPDRSDQDTKHTWLVSFGGFNPRFQVPGRDIYVPKRLQMSFARGDHVKIDWRLYAALTPGLVHFGFSIELTARAAGFGIHGLLALDLLILYRRLQFVADVTFTVDLQLGGSTFAGLSFKGTLKGIFPAELSGRVSISFLFWSWTSPRIVLTLEEGQDADETVDVAPQIAAAVADVRNWDNGGVPGLKLRAGERPGVWLSPSAPLTFRQAIVPLERQVTRCGSAALSGPTVFSVVPQRPADAGWTSRSVDGEFAPGLYVDLSPEEGLSAASFVAMPAGFAIDRPLGTGTAADQALDYELVVVDSANPPPAPHVPRPIVTFASEVLDASAECSPSLSDRVRVSSVRPLAMSADAFAVVDAILAPVATSVDFLEAVERVRSGGNGELVVPAVEVV